MRRRLLIIATLAALLLGVAVCSRAAHVEFQWAQFNLQTHLLTNRVFFLTPMSAPTGVGANVISADRRPYTNNVLATAVASNVVSGAYKVDLTGPYAQTTFIICVPETNALIQASTIICSSTNLPTAGSLAYASSVSDLRYVQSNTNGAVLWPTNFFPVNVIAGTNIFIEYLGNGVIRLNLVGGVSTSAPPAGTYYLLTGAGDNFATGGGDRLVWAP